MAVESAADLASMFDDAEFAEHALYLSPVPGSSPAACTPVVDRGQGRERFDAGENRAAASERHLWVRAAELPAVARDGLFRMTDAEGAETGEVFRVLGLPKLDQLAALWSVQLAIVD